MGNQARLTEYFIASGSNIFTKGISPIQRVRSGFAALHSDSIQVTAISPIYSSPAFPKGSGPDFANAAARVVSALPPEDLLARLHTIEEHAGRERNTRWGPRPLDLDLLAAGDVVLPTPDVQRAWMDLPLKAQMETAPEALILPHPRIQDRAFVLVPLCDIAPDWRHPVLELTAQEMLARLPKAARAELTQIDDHL